MVRADRCHLSLRTSSISPCLLCLGRWHNHCNVRNRFFLSYWVMFVVTLMDHELRLVPVAGVVGMMQELMELTTTMVMMHCVGINSQ